MLLPRRINDAVAEALGVVASNDNALAFDDACAVKPDALVALKPPLEDTSPPTTL